MSVKMQWLMNHSTMHVRICIECTFLRCSLVSIVGAMENIAVSITLEKSNIPRFRNFFVDLFLQKHQ